MSLCWSVRTVEATKLPAGISCSNFTAKLKIQWRFKSLILSVISWLLKKVIAIVSIFILFWVNFVMPFQMHRGETGVGEGGKRCPEEWCMGVYSVPTPPLLLDHSPSLPTPPQPMHESMTSAQEQQRLCFLFSINLKILGFFFLLFSI